MRLRENRAYPGTGSEGDFSLGTHGGRESHVMGLAASRFPGVVSSAVFAQADVQHPMQPKEGGSTRTQNDTCTNWGFDPAQYRASES